MIKKIWASALALLFFCSAFGVPASAEEINLAALLPYIITTGEPIAHTYEDHVSDGMEYNRDEGRLTDTVVATDASPSSDVWYRAYSGQSRNVIFDLGGNCSIESASLNFLQCKAQGIYIPRYIKASLSVNGTDYMEVARYNDTEAIYKTEDSVVAFYLDFHKKYSARYVKLEFCADLPVFCDEITVNGSKSLSGREANIEPQPSEDSMGYSEDIGGYRNILKLYNGYYAENEFTGILTETELMPYIGYEGTDGEIKGKMFDALILAPCRGDYPSGNDLYSLEGESCGLMADWESYFASTFTAGQDLDAINSVAGKVYQKLGITEKLGIFLTVPYPVITDRPFGDINGDGSAEYSQTLSDRRHILRWYMDKCVETFNDNDYDNLVLAGFYWAQPSIDYFRSDHEEALVEYFNSHAGDMELSTLFSADYLASGFDHWQELGFNGAVMRSEYDGDLGEEMLDEFAMTAYNNNLGAEIRMFSQDELLSSLDYPALGHAYEKQLYYGTEKGYKTALTVYDQGIGTGALYDLCNADTSTEKGIYLRRLYDMTYRYICGTYENVPPAVMIETEAELPYGEEQLVLEYGISDFDSDWEDISVIISQTALHGKISLDEAEGMFTYIPEDGYFGNDSFAFYVTDEFNRSEEITVNITVSGPPEPPRSDVTVDSASVEPPPLSGIQDGMPLWLVIVLSLLGGSMVVVALVTIFKPKVKE